MLDRNSQRRTFYGQSKTERRMGGKLRESWADQEVERTWYWLLDAEPLGNGKTRREGVSPRTSV